ncbi:MULTISPECIES: hypothetical protein [Myxococcaceae]|uniref:hypothetical protein n=1 Tax=Myxococcaceae TaxID=31 RepID=UPI00129C1119|nr:MULTISPECIES: hypothetical protein [Myxococcaceae]MBF5043010.1 hypothetical protein [Simulacricoccus sp. 17bor-14]
MTVELLQAHGLRTALARAAQLFEERVEEPLLLEAAARGIEQEVDAISEALRGS